MAADNDYASELAAALAENVNLKRALISARLIGAAVGVVMVTERLTYDAAFRELSRASQSSNRKLGEIADEVVLTGVLTRKPVNLDPRKKPTAETGGPAARPAPEF